jgi:methionyl-tRNA synthetase
MNVYFTTAIHYVNAAPHLGHAYEWVLADALVRNLRRTRSVRLLAGTDEHSLKNVRAAEAAGRSVEALVDENAARFIALAARLGLEHDDFIRTSEQRHKRGVEDLWRRCASNGDLDQRTYSGLYCVGCEAFYASEDLVDGGCAEHSAPLELVEEQNWFFRLSRYASELEALIRSGRIAIVPERAKNEVLAFLGRGLRDFSVSRSFARARAWGIPVPGDDSQVIYVWFDALASYLTSLEGSRPLWWDDAERVHLIGKGITIFHAVYWPAILLSAGIAPPSRILVHGYLTNDGKKIGKSLGNAIDPNALIDRYGVDALRYYLLRHFRPFEDGDFSEERLRGVFESDLADQLGNLIERTATLLSKSGGAGPSVDLPSYADGLTADVRSAFERHRPDQALEAIWSVVTAANRSLTERAPWSALKRGDVVAAVDVLGPVVAAIRLVALELAPLLPATSVQIVHRLGGECVRPGPQLFDKRSL